MNIITRNLEPKDPTKDSEILIEDPEESAEITYINVSFFAVFFFILILFFTGEVSKDTALVSLLVASLFAKIHFSK